MNATDTLPDGYELVARRPPADKHKRRLDALANGRAALKRVAEAQGRHDFWLKDPNGGSPVTLGLANRGFIDLARHRSRPNIVRMTAAGWAELGEASPRRAAGNVVALLAAAVGLALAAPAPADARLVDVDAVRAKVGQAAKHRTPSPWSPRLDRVEWATADRPRSYRTSVGFCRRASRGIHPGGRRANCWVVVWFPDWPGCTIYDLWGAHQRSSGRVKVWQYDTWTTYSAACPGFGTIGVEELEGDQ